MEPTTATRQAHRLENLEREFGRIEGEIEQFIAEATDFALGGLARGQYGDRAAEEAALDAQHDVLRLVKALEGLRDGNWIDELFGARYRVESAALRPPTR